MDRFKFLVAVCFGGCYFVVTACFAQVEQPALKLWYNKPARVWEEALPLGNATTGAMVFGGKAVELYQLNDNTLWSGGPNAGNNENGPAILPQLRESIFAGNYNEARDLWKKMQGPYSARYLPLGDLQLTFTDQDSVYDGSYKRELDIERAICKVTYEEDGVRFTRETFISRPDQGMVIQLKADKPKSISFELGLTSKLRYKTTAAGNNTLVLRGKAPSHVAHRRSEPQQIVYDNDKGEGMNFNIQVKVRAKGGKIRGLGDKLVIEGADEATLWLAEATSFNGFDKSPGLQGRDAEKLAKKMMKALSAQNYERLKSRHVSDYAALFNRVSINLGDDGEGARLPTDVRLKKFTENAEDQALLALYYQFGRYLLISSSRPGGRPSNLQGIWNHLVQPPWGSNYTTNINTQMNYWLAENTNLSECHEPLFNFISELSENGAVTAKVNYGINDGWVTHHNSDIWAKTSPVGGYEWDPMSRPSYVAWPMAGAWFSTHLWEHYLYTLDSDFLQKKAYPLMKGAAQFMLHWLIEDSKGQYLVTNPSTSPENTVKIDRKEYDFSIASTMDMAIIRELFSACIKSADLLKIDKPFRDSLAHAIDRLYPYHIGQYGQLQEWYQDWDDPNDQHRHISHLFGLYPGNQISPFTTPELAAAAKKTMEQRGDASTGWSMAWKTNWWARLLDGNHAYKILRDALRYIDPVDNNVKMTGGGAYPNLMDAHPPFQIDGNFGATAGITEMLLQSHAGELHLLPALPDTWRKGEIKGIRGRGNFNVALAWNDARLIEAKIVANQGGLCRIRTAIPVRIVKAGSTSNLAPAVQGASERRSAIRFEKKDGVELAPLPLKKTYLLDFKTVKGQEYIVQPL